MSAAEWAFAAALVAVVIPAVLKLYLTARALRTPAALEARLITLQQLSIATQQDLDDALAENRAMDEKLYREQVGHAIAERQLAAAREEIERLRRELNGHGGHDD